MPCKVTTWQGIFFRDIWCAAPFLYSTWRAAVADLTGIENRGTAYGLFNTIYGGAWFLGSTVMGFLYDFSVTLVALFVVTMEGASIIAFFLLRKDVLALRQVRPVNT